MMMVLGHLHHHRISPAFFPISKSPTPKFSCKFSVDSFDKYPTAYKKPSINWSNNLISLAIAVALVAPLPSSAIPSLSSLTSKPSPPSPTTPFSQAQNLPTGLENGKIRPCPAINPGCISSNPKSSSFSFPWSIEGKPTSSVAVQQLQDAILKTQKNAKIQLVQDTPNGQYVEAEVDGGFGRDVLEFLVNGDVVSYRAMATKVTYVYPFTTALGDSKGQEERLKQIVDELGWYAPRFDAMD